MGAKLLEQAGIGLLNKFNEVYSYMKYTNVGSYSTAIANGMHQVDEYEDDVNSITKVYAITRDEWKAIRL